MALRLEDRWAWDRWLVDAGERYHAFSLPARRVDPDRPAGPTA